MLKRLCVPVDGSSLSEVAAFAGIALARQLGAAVVGFSCAPTEREDVSNAAMHAAARTADERQRKERQLLRRLDVLRGEAAAAGVPFEGSAVISDDPASEIVDAATRHQCDLIVMGTHGRKGIARLLKGSITARVLALADLPVMVYRITDLEVAAHRNRVELAAALHREHPQVAATGLDRSPLNASR